MPIVKISINIRDFPEFLKFLKFAFSVYISDRWMRVPKIFASVQLFTAS